MRECSRQKCPGGNKHFEVIRECWGQSEARIWHKQPMRRRGSKMHPGSCIFNSLNHNSLDIWEWGSSSGNISNYIIVRPVSYSRWRFVHLWHSLSTREGEAKLMRVFWNSDYSDIWSCNDCEWQEHQVKCSPSRSERRMTPSSSWVSSIIIQHAVHCCGSNIPVSISSQLAHLSQLNCVFMTWYCRLLATRQYQPCGV